METLAPPLPIAVGELRTMEETLRKTRQSSFGLEVVSGIGTGRKVLSRRRQQLLARVPGKISITCTRGRPPWDNINHMISFVLTRCDMSRQCRGGYRSTVIYILKFVVWLRDVKIIEGCASMCNTHYGDSYSSFHSDRTPDNPPKCLRIKIEEIPEDIQIKIGRKFGDA